MLISKLRTRNSSILIVGALLTALSLTPPAAAQDSLGDILARLVEIQSNETATRPELEEATGLVARIVQEFPASEAAANIVSGRVYEGIDFSSFEARLQEAPPAVATAPAAPAGQLPNFLGGTTETEQAAAPSTPPAAPLPNFLAPPPATEADQTATAPAPVPVAPAPGAAPNPAFPTFGVAPQAAAPAPPPGAAPLPTFLAPVALPPSSPETEALLELDRQAIRDLQARLLVSGFDPNGVDGVLGRGARGALSSWQGTVGVDPNGYLNAEQLQALKTQSQAQLELWLQEPGNASTYKPPVAAAKTQRKKKRVRVCNRNALGILYNCRYVLR